MSFHQLVATFDGGLPANLSAGGTAAVDAGQFRLPCTAGYTSLFSSPTTFDLTGQSVAVQVISQPGAVGTREFIIELELDANNAIFMFHSGGDFVGRLRQGGANDSATLATYSATTHAWWRIRESGGSILWETSPDGVGWSTLRTLAYTMAITGLLFTISCGFFGSETSPPDAVIDSLNFYPRPPGPQPLAVRRRAANH